MYEGQWGWLAILQKAEIGDEITITLRETKQFSNESRRNSHKFTGRFAVDRNGNLIIVNDAGQMDQGYACLNGELFELSHDEGGLGERISLWSVSADQEELTYKGSQTGIIGKLGPKPGRPVSDLGKGLVVSFSMLAIAEFLEIGALAIEAAPGAGPLGPILVVAGLGSWGMGAIFFIAGYNTLSAPNT